MIVQVRAAATMGGNLVLAKEQGLQSDVATLMSALQAQVGITSVEDEHLRHVLHRIAKLLMHYAVYLKC